MKSSSASIIVLIGIVVISGCVQQGTTTEQTTQPAQAAVPQGRILSAQEVSEIAALFSDNPLTGGQVAPRLSKWVSDEVFLFVQFNTTNLSRSASLRYIGVGVKGVFCKEAQSDSERESFTHLHKLSAPTYGTGHANQSGDQGYWLTWTALDEFLLGNRSVKPGIDYEFAKQVVPSCVSVPAVNFTGPDAHRLSKTGLAELVAFFDDNPLVGGQVAPRLSKWVNNDTFIFIQLDNPNVANATSVRYFGIGVRGEFCKSKQPSTDFPHLHKYSAPTYGEGHAKEPGDKGYWLLWVAADTFQLGNRTVTPGVDRQFALQQVPECAGQPAQAKEFTIEADDTGFYPSGMVTVSKGGLVKITFSVRAAGTYFGGLDFRSEVWGDTGTVKPGESKTVEFTAGKTFTFTSYWPASNQKKADGQVIVS